MELTTLNYNQYVTALQNQIMKLQLVTPLNIVDVLIDTKNRFPVSQIFNAQVYRIGNNTSYVQFHNASYDDLLGIRNQYIDVLQDELQHIQRVVVLTWNVNSLDTLFFNPLQFSNNFVLHAKNGNELKVADLLKVVGYAKKFIETSGVEVDEKISIALMVFDTLDLALNNEKQDKPFNKALHIANDVLTEIAKKIKPQPITNSQISGTSLLFDLAIDFLVKG